MSNITDIQVPEKIQYETANRSQQDIQKAVNYYLQNQNIKQRYNNANKTRNAFKKAHGNKNQLELIKEYLLEEKNKDRDQYLMNSIKELKEQLQPFQNITPSQIKPFMNDKNNSEIYQMRNELDKEQNQFMMSALKQGSNAPTYEQATQNLNDLKNQADKIADEMNLDHLSKSQLKSIVALDDWASLAKWAIPLIYQYGKPIIQNLYDQYVYPKFKQEIDRFSGYLGGDSGMNMVDQQVFQKEQSRQQFQQNINQFSENLKEDNGCLDLNAVNQNFLCTLLNPESYHFRIPQDFNQKTSLSHVSYEVSIDTGASGKAQVLIFPFKYQHQVQYNNDFDINNGEPNIDNVLVDNPFSALQGQYNELMTTATSVSLNSIIGDNANGSITMMHTHRQPNIHLANQNQRYYPLSTIHMEPYTITGNAYGEYRMILPLTQDVQLRTITEANSTYDHGFFILLTGFPANTKAKLIVTQVIEYIPSPTQATLSVQDSADIGPATRDVASVSISKYPSIQSASHKESVNMCNKILQSTCKYQDVMRSIQDSVIEVTAKSVLRNAITGSNINQIAQAITQDMTLNGDESYQTLKKQAVKR